MPPRTLFCVSILLSGSPQCGIEPHSAALSCTHTLLLTVGLVASLTANTLVRAGPGDFEASPNKYKLKSIKQLRHRHPIHLLTAHRRHLV